MSEEQPALILVGTDREGIRLWRAREAVRQGEMRLAQLSAVFDGLRSQATSLLGWATTLGSGICLFALTAHAHWVAAVTFIVTVSEAAMCIATIWPTATWSSSTFRPREIMGSSLDTELEETESTAYGLDTSIERNTKIVDRRFFLLRLAWFGLPAIPVVAALFAIAGR